MKIQSALGFKEKLVEQITMQVMDYILDKEGKLLRHLMAMNR